jgi:hypothetical protein
VRSFYPECALQDGPGLGPGVRGAL